LTARHLESKTSRKQEIKITSKQYFKKTRWQENNAARNQEIKKTIFLDSAEIHKHGPNMA
jgi:hypothetical protein